MRLQLPAPPREHNTSSDMGFKYISSYQVRLKPLVTNHPPTQTMRGCECFSDSRLRSTEQIGNPCSSVPRWAFTGTGHSHLFFSHCTNDDAFVPGLRREPQSLGMPV
jgi:hypothetical protein